MTDLEIFIQTPWYLLQMNIRPLHHFQEVFKIRHTLAALHL